MIHTGSIPLLSGFFPSVQSSVFLAASAGGGSPGWMNDFLIDIHFCHPLLVSSLKLLPLFHSLSRFPSLSVRIPSYLSEQGFGSLWGKRQEREETNQNKQFGKRHAVRAKFIKASDFFLPPHSPLGCFAELCGACGYFRLSALQWFGMDAIMLQEKLVERLLCPRVRTARQKVKPGSILGTHETKHQESLWDVKSQGPEVTAGGFYWASAVMVSPPCGYLFCFIPEWEF